MKTFGILMPGAINFNFNESVILTKKNCTIYNHINLNEFISSTHDFKVAVYDSRPSSIDIKSLPKCDYIIIHNMEFHEIDLAAVNKLQNFNIVFSINGIVHKNLNCKIITSLEWLSSTVHPYKNELKSRLESLNCFEEKPLYFDFLPGRPRLHRKLVAKYIKQFQLEHKFLSSDFFSEYGSEKPKSFNPILWDEELANFDYDSSSLVALDNINLVSSQIIPVKIYNNTCYSIVAETTARNSYAFYTEKVVKPMLAKRLFVVFAGKHYLKGLKDLGFRTFDGIIDESYDNIEDNEIRWRMAFDQVEFLCNQPQKEILTKIMPIVIHNYRHSLNYNWVRNLNYTIEDLFTTLIQ
jgi:hypothetical protein